ncbi:amidase [Planococcus halotolerans]|uniref:Amidase n=1 Tax=Planococcus halotolerans TaxID=2233542 RepID=A0A365KXM0_9BACL|nr:amidase [Planococcus halotolerans]QHJ72063.1 amidase [Planococcus halotolerans]RAZ77921.1 amidase [Planococcus halotolerans]
MLNTPELVDSLVLDLDAAELAQLIKENKISSRKAVEIYIKHLNNINPSINCLVENRFEEALQEADYADRVLAEGTAEGALWGVPISMKEAFHVSGMKTTGGLLGRKEKTMEKDAEVVRKLRMEGAVILGKSNTPELCFCQETDNKLYGRTNNPWDIKRTAGGSSGGEAALIAVGGAAAGLGSDIGGSIRFPSHFNGVVGFKSGKGQVSQEGSFPEVTQELQERMLGIGPITKSVKDARLLYNIVAKNPAANREFDNFVMNVLPDSNYPMADHTRRLLDAIFQKVSSEFEVEREMPPYFGDSATVWQEIMSINGSADARREAYGDNPRNLYNSYLKERLTGKSEVHRYLSWALIGASLFKPSDKRLDKIREFLQHGDHILEHYLRERILIMPIYHKTAPKHGVVYREIFSIRKSFRQYLPYVAYANTWGLPSLTLPLGSDEKGLPIGIQLISSNGNEEALFQLGEWLELNFRTYKRAIL